MCGLLYTLIKAMYLLLSHHLMLVKCPVISMLSIHGVGMFLEESHGVLCNHMYTLMVL